MAAVRAGLLLAADDEGLWRDLLRATHATGDPPAVRAVIDALRGRAASTCSNPKPKPSSTTSPPTSRPAAPDRSPAADGTAIPGRTQG